MPSPRVLIYSKFAILSTGFTKFVKLVIMVTIIKKLCRDKNISFRQLEIELGLSNGSLRRWDENSPSVDKALLVARFFGVSLEYLCGIDTPAAPVDGLSADIARLDAHGRKLVEAIVAVELDKAAPVETKIIPLFAAAAGPGEPVDGEPLDEYEVDAKSPAQFAVKISGDSMEPELHDGEIVLCKRKRPQTGELAVINVNGFMLVKQYIADGFGNIYLRSINRARKALDVDLWASGNDTAVGYGVVIHRKLELVRE
jgi:phage repressor protein C with HTH and peptisase S24 domain